MAAAALTDLECCKQYVESRGLSTFCATRPDISIYMHWGTQIVSSFVFLCTSLPLCEDYVSGFFADHVDGADDEEAGDAWKDGGVDDAQTLRAVDAEVRVEDAVLFAWSNRTGAGRVMAPRVFAHKRVQIFDAFTLGTRNLFSHD